MNELQLKSEIFDLFESARELFNDYCNGKENYTDKDINRIREIIQRIEIVNLYYIKECISDYKLSKGEN